MNVHPMGGQYQVMSSNLQRLFQEDMYMYQLFSNDIDSIMLFSDRMCFQSIFEASVAIKNKKDNRPTRQYAIALSDDGATLNLLVATFSRSLHSDPLESGVRC